MNELMIVLEGGQWIYFPTNQTTVDKAFQAFNESCDSIGLNLDNVDVREAILRDSEGHVINCQIFGGSHD